MAIRSLSLSRPAPGRPSPVRRGPAHPVPDRPNRVRRGRSRAGGGRRALLWALAYLGALACTFGTISTPARGYEPPPVAGAESGPNSALRIPTLLEAIDLALANGPDMAVARKGLEGARLGAAAARAALSWRVDATGSYSYEAQKGVPQSPSTGQNPSTAGLASGFGPQGLSEAPGGSDSSVSQADARVDLDDTQKTATISLQRTLSFDPFVVNQLRKADLGAEQAALMLERAAQETVKAVFDAYRQLELALIRRQVLAESLRVAAMGWDAARTHAEAGTLSHEDAEAARLDLAAAELEYSTSERMLEVARLYLAQRLGVEDLPAADELPVPTLDELRQLIASKSVAYWPEQPVPWGAGLDELKERAVAGRPDVRLAQARVLQAEIDVEQARLARRPVFSAEATYTQKDGEASISLNSRGGLSATLSAYDLYDVAARGMPFESKWEVRVGASVNLWDSAQAAIEVRRAEAALEQATIEWQQARSGAELDVSNRYISAVAAQTRLRLESERVLLALDRLEAERRRLELGLATPLTVAAGELDVHAAVVQAHAARIEYEKALVELAVSAGMPLEELRALVASF